MVRRDWAKIAEKHVARAVPKVVISWRMEIGSQNQYHMPIDVWSFHIRQGLRWVIFIFILFRSFFMMADCGFCNSWLMWKCGYRVFVMCLVRNERMCQKKKKLLALTRYWFFVRQKQVFSARRIVLFLKKKIFISGKDFFPHDIICQFHVWASCFWKSNINDSRILSEVPCCMNIWLGCFMALSHILSPFFSHLTCHSKAWLMILSIRM